MSSSDGHATHLPPPQIGTAEAATDEGGEVVELPFAGRVRMFIDHGARMSASLPADHLEHNL